MRNYKQLLTNSDWFREGFAVTFPLRVNVVAYFTAITIDHIKVRYV